MTALPSPPPPAAWWHRYASLRIKTLSLIAAAVLGLFLLLYIPLRRELLASFRDLETETMQANVARVLSALNDELASLNGTTGDYATWDDTYQFVADGNQEYIDINVADNAMANSRISLFLVYDGQRRLVLGKGLDLETGLPRSVPAVFGQAPPARLLQLPETSSVVTGVLVLDDETFLLAARPIITTDGAGPIRGTLVMGRAVNGPLVDRLASTTHLAVALPRVDSLAIPAELRETIRTGAAPAIHPLDGRRIVGYQALSDLSGANSLAVRVESERAIYARALVSARYLSLAMLLGGLVLGLAVILLIERIVLSRLVQLDGAVGSVSAAQNLSARVPVRGHDELARLGRSINGLLAGIEQAQARQLGAEAARQELQDRTIRSQSAALARLSTPLIPISQRVLALPLIGEVDAARSARVMETILRGAAERRAAAVILDITGVTAVNGELVDLLARAGLAVRLIGARLILTGLGAEAARALVELDADLAGVVTLRDLEAGIAFALEAGQG